MSSSDIPQNLSKSRRYIQVPESLSLSETIRFTSQLKLLEPADEYVFDFARTRNTEPFGMLLLSNEIRSFSGTRTESRVGCTQVQHLSYPAHMGFFQSFGAEYGKRPGQASGSRTYVPITTLRCEDIARDAVTAGRELGQHVEEISKKLAEPLSSSDSGVIFETFTYSIREIIRNVVEHSEAKSLDVCCQYWPSKARAEVAIVDRGVGLRATLQRNPHLDVLDDKQAVNYAQMPAVSGRAYKGGPRQDKHSQWKNSGFGLYMTSRICRDGGNFFLGSGNIGILLTAGKDSKRYFSMTHEGTAVRLIIQTNNLRELNNSLARYRNEGYEIQRRYKEIVDIDPSAASLMLSENFDLSVWKRLLARLKS